MNLSSRKEAIVLFVGDSVSLFVSLFIALSIRNLAIPTGELFLSHIIPFSYLFIVWIILAFIAGLYEKQTIIFKNKVSQALLNVQLMYAVVSLAFFYFIPFFEITPKVTLFIYILVSFIVIFFWRTVALPRFARRKKVSALIVGEGKEIQDLVTEVNNNSRYDIFFVTTIDPRHSSAEAVMSLVKEKNISVIAIDTRSESVASLLPGLYPLLLKGVRFVDTGKMYEDIFDRIALSLVGKAWFVENVSLAPKILFDVTKRAMDIGVSFILGVCSLVLYPFVSIAIKLDDGGPLFITQHRVGKHGTLVKIFKFRSMSGNDLGKYVGGQTQNKVTRVGGFLRRTRIDELPQLYNVLRGELSLIGPRPELPSLVSIYEKEIPYYGVRHLITPGLSGWAQIYHEAHPHHMVATEDTKDKLSYDLFYIKNRSILIDVKIALRTLQTLLMQVGK